MGYPYPMKQPLPRGTPPGTTGAPGTSGFQAQGTAPSSSGVTQAGARASAPGGVTQAGASVSGGMAQAGVSTPAGAVGVAAPTGVVRFIPGLRRIAIRNRTTTEPISTSGSVSTMP